MTRALCRSSLAVAAAGLAMSGPAWAALVPVYEPFNYTAGTPLSGQGSDAVHTWAATGTGPDEPVVGAGNLAVPAPLPAAPGNRAVYGGTGMTDRLSLVDTPGTGVNQGAVYYSLALTVTNTGNVTGQAGAVGQIIAGFNNTVGPQAGNPSAHGADLWIQPGATAGTFRVGFSQTSATSTRAFHSEEFDLGETVFVVAAYEYVEGGTNNDRARVWINPTSGLGQATEPAATLTAQGATADLNDIESFLLFQTATSTTNTLGEGGVQVDELRVGDSWQSVTPEPSALALLGLGGVLFLRRGRRSR